MQARGSVRCQVASVKVSPAIESSTKTTVQPDDGTVEAKHSSSPEQPLPSGKPHEDPEYLPAGEANMSVEAAPATAAITRDIVFVTSEVGLRFGTA